MSVNPCEPEASEPNTTRTRAGSSTLLKERGPLINLAYRLLGSVTDAEDAVQEGYARWYALSPEQQERIDVPGAWLNTVVSRVCLDVLRSARVRRERYVGAWVPEPVPDVSEWPGAARAGAADPADRITLDESVHMAFLIVLDSMTPAERVAFLLHDVFGYPFDEIADIVGRSSAACRQLASSARRRVRDAQPVSTPAPQRARVVRDFKQAWEAMDVGALIRVLDPGATAIADGGGLVTASLYPTEGATRVAQYFVELTRTVGDLELMERTVNGQPGLVATYQGQTVAVYSFEIAGDYIQRIWVVRNPEKLGPWIDL